MKNLLRAAAVCAPALTALSTVEANTFGTCLIRCYSPNAPGSSTYTTREECCGQSFDQYWPAGSSGIGAAWNGRRC